MQAGPRSGRGVSILAPAARPRRADPANGAKRPVRERSARCGSGAPRAEAGSPL